MTGKAWRITTASAAELSALRRLLVVESLPHQGVETHAVGRFLVARSPGGGILGGVGLEGAGSHALLRSLVIDPIHRGSGLGQALVAAIEAVARRDGVEVLYLLTTTAAGFFLRIGYQFADRATVPAALQQTDEFSTLCPADADCLVKRMDPRDGTDAPGSSPYG